MTATVQRHEGTGRARAAQRYTAAELTGLFFAFSAVGWLWEVALHLVLEGELVNRGTMLGPWLPIYGAGGVLAVLLLRRFADRPVLTFALGTALCTAVEYGTGKYLLAVYGQRWWDYSMYPLNIDGLISPLTSLLFGLGCCAAVYVAAPALRRIFQRLPRMRLRLICAALAALFALDFGVCTLRPNAGQGVTVTPATQDSLRVIEPSQINLLLQNLPK